MLALLGGKEGTEEDVAAILKSAGTSADEGEYAKISAAIAGLKEAGTELKDVIAPASGTPFLRHW